MLAHRSFAVWLRDAMAKQSLSAPTLARHLALPQGTVAGWLHGIAQPKSNVLAPLAEALGVTIAELRRALEGDGRG